MEKIKEYHLIVMDGEAALNLAVNNKIREGWQPFAPPFLIKEKMPISQSVMGQVVVKYN